MHVSTFTLPTETSVYTAARRCLTNWLRKSPDPYRRLFEEGVSSRNELPGDVTPLRELGIIDSSDGLLFSSKCVYPYDGMFILCDRPTDKHLDRVFPIYSDESALLAKWMAAVKPGEIVLDLGTGSGIIALAAAKQGAGKVFASDVNERAHAYFDMTVKLNGFASCVEYVSSDAYDSLEGIRFDVIASNPPFVPVPERLEYFIHSDGGPFGTAIIERILSGLDNHLSVSGRMYALSLSLGVADRWRIDSLLYDYSRCSTRNMVYHMHSIYSDPLYELSALTDRFKMAEGYDKWVSDLETQGYDRLRYFAFYIGPSKESGDFNLHGLMLGQAGPDLPFWRSVEGSMENRLRRYIVSK